MLLNIRVVPEGHSEVSGTTDLAEFCDGLPKLKKPVAFRAEIDRRNEDIYLHIWYNGVFDLQCSRCLNCYESKIEGDFRLILKESIGNTSEESEDDGVDFYFEKDQDTIDLSAALYEEIMIAVPLKPLCSSECKGINISDNGIVIDYGDGTKKEEKVDPRWNELLKLKKNS